MIAPEGSLQINDETTLHDFISGKYFAVFICETTNADIDYDLAFREMVRWHSMSEYADGFCHLQAGNLGEIDWLSDAQRAQEHSVTVYWQGIGRYISYEPVGEYVNRWVKALYDSYSGDGNDAQADAAGRAAVVAARHRTAAAAAAAAAAAGGGAVAELAGGVGILAEAVGGGGHGAAGAGGGGGGIFGDPDDHHDLIVEFDG